jgi:hypothetical protein
MLFFIILGYLKNYLKLFHLRLFFYYFKLLRAMLFWGIPP